MSPEPRPEPRPEPAPPDPARGVLRELRGLRAAVGARLDGDAGPHRAPKRPERLAAPKPPPRPAPAPGTREALCAAITAELASRARELAAGPRTWAELARALGVGPTGLHRAYRDAGVWDAYPYPPMTGPRSVEAIEVVLGPRESWGVEVER